MTYRAPSVYNGKSELSGVTVVRDPHCLTSVSFSLSMNFEAITSLSHEWYVGADVLIAMKVRLTLLGIDKLDTFQLDFVVDHTEELDERIGLEERIEAVHAVPARKMILDFKDIKVRGKISEFLVSGSRCCPPGGTGVQVCSHQDALRNGIEAWPLGIDTMQFKVFIDDFGPGSELLDQFDVQAEDHVNLTEGWIPTEDSMIAFVESVLEYRPDLHRFKLAILAGGDVRYAIDEAWRQVFRFDYVTDDVANLSRDRSDNSTVTSNDVNNVGNTSAAPIQAGMQSEPEIKTIIGHTAIRALYDDAMEGMKHPVIRSAVRAL